MCVCLCVSNLPNKNVRCDCDKKSYHGQQTKPVLFDFRFFVLNNEAGLLEYFVNEQSRPQKPRGMLPLAGAVISPSDEDSHTFTVNAISGEQYKLRGEDLAAMSALS